MFNPNELVLEKVRSVEEYDLTTDDLIGRYTQIEEPTLETGATPTEVLDAMGTPIATFYNAQTGTFNFTNSLFSLDLAASQFGTQKVIASNASKIIMEVSETPVIASDATVVLKYTPVGTAGAEIKYVKIINKNNTFGETFEISATAGAGKFTLDVATKTITLPAGTTGKAFVKYYRESDKAVKVSKSTNSTPNARKLIINAIFHDPCNTDLVYAGVIVCHRARPDISTVSITLTPEGKHSASYVLEKSYCDEDGTLFDILVSED